MGRHSRRGPAPKDDARPARGTTPPGQGAASGGTGAYGPPTHPAPPGPYGSPGQAARGDGIPAGPGTPAHGAHRFPDGTPAHGFPRLPDGAPAHGVPGAGRGGGHPEQREPGGGWGEVGGRGASAGSADRALPLPGQRQAPPEQPGGRQGPRQDYLDAFGEGDDVFASRRTATARPASGADRAHPADPCAAVTDRSSAPAAGDPVGPDDDAPPTGAPEQGKGAKGRAFAGTAAAAVTTVLAIVVAGQVADERDGSDGLQSQSAPEQAARDVRDPGVNGGADDDRGTSRTEPLTYAQKMDRKFPLSATAEGSGRFDAITGIADGSGKGQKITYRVDVEQGLGLDGALFAEAVHRTLNDNRSWAHNGARTFERIHSGRPDFVITLASPATTAEWCAKSGLDTTVDNVSCDSAATERVMINAFRWARGAATYGDELLAYRQMLINHEVGHRLGYNHVTCDKDGDLAPVMQQQTKFLEHDGISCRPNAWAYPNS
ncbi:DUF3152 domain-containing protein [Streptomyces sp. KMM 9044]|uniref:DUF3152 domain-containing protein n=1 Tax=Streptomyces sp. KMM 9044 TaxID=2744474 RepID=UPI00215167A7|nr:DUF3152 domain-containing protein [Streptomyces sp. KMM 9044]WAX78079.1 DUF3152 domain-containing protein [Streptomyces sp. KMM 9044]